MTSTQRSKRALLISSSVVALAVSNALPALAFCPSAPQTISTGQSVSRICLIGSSASGNIENSGTIGAGGILFSSGTLTGSILGASGTFIGGIGLDATSTLASTHTAIAIAGGSFAGAISNAGTISAGGDGIAVSKIVQFGSPSAGGGLVNTGTITAGPGGIVASDVSAFSGGISNGGTISAAVTGLSVTSVGAFTGGISNSGTITSGNPSISNNYVAAGGFGIAVLSANQFSGSSAGGAIRNTGTIAANRTGILVASVGTFSGGISNGGAISANLTGIDVSKVGQFGSPSAGGGIVNTGTIIASIVPTIGNFGAGISSSATSFFGGISNGGTIISASFGIELASGGSIFSGGIANSGTISAYLTAIAVNGPSQFNGGITNSGMISSPFGIGVSGTSTFGGNISNSGTIIASIGINAGHLGGLSFAAGSGIVNSGTILASDVGIAVNEGLALYGFGSVGGSITNSGTISAANGGILVSSVVQFGRSSEGGSIVNSGTITAGGNAIDVQDVGAFTGGISNSGTITSGSLGIDVSNVSFQFGNASVGGGIVNSGAITARYTGIFAGAASTIAGGISNSGTITAGHTGIVVAVVNTFLGGISNSGVITAREDGIGVFSAVQFSGSSMGGGIVNGGAINSGHNGIIVLNVDTFSGGITNSGTISATKAGILYGDALSFSGGITNSGNITSANTGIFVGTVYAFAGGITNSGTISAVTGIEIVTDVGFAAGSDVVNRGTIYGSTAAIDASSATSPVTIDQTAGLITGAIKLSAYADVLNISGGTIAGNIVGQGTSDTINFTPGAGTAFTYASDYGFTGVNQVNIDAGTTVLDGSNSATATAVNAGGTLAGTGMLTSALVVNNGGTLSPGNPGSAGTFLVTGSLAFASGSTYAVTINGATASQTVVAGSATLGGASISLTLPPLLGTYAARTYDILTTTAPLGAGNTFDPTVMVTRPGPIVAPNVTYDANDVYLSVPAYQYTLDLPANSPSNAHNIANALNAYIVAGGIPPNAIQPLGRLSGASLGSALNQLGGQAPGGSTLSAFAAGDLFLNLLLDPNVDGRGADRPTPGGAPLAGYAALAPSLSPAPVLWASAYGGSDQISGNAATGAAATSLSVYGFAAGADFHFAPDAMIGLALGGGASGSGSGAFGASSSQMFQAGVFGRYSPGPAYVSAALAYSANDVSVTRSGGLGGEQKGGFASNVLSSRIEAGYVLPGSFGFALTPYAAAQAQALSMPTFAESAQAVSGAPLALTYAGRTFTTDRIELGARLDDTLAIGGGAVKLFGRVAYTHDFNHDSAVTAEFQSLPSASFVINSAKPAANGALATLGARYDIGAGWSLQGQFDGEFSGTTSFYAATGVIRKSW